MVINGDNSLLNITDSSGKNAKLDPVVNTRYTKVYLFNHIFLQSLIIEIY